MKPYGEGKRRGCYEIRGCVVLFYLFWRRWPPLQQSRKVSHPAKLTFRWWSKTGAIFAPVWTSHRRSGGTTKDTKNTPTFVWDGSVSSNDKPRYLVIWSKSGSIDDAKLSKPDGIPRQPSSSNRGRSPMSTANGRRRLKRRLPQLGSTKARYSMAQVSLVTISFDGKTRTASRLSGYPCTTIHSGGPGTARRFWRAR